MSPTPSFRVRLAELRDVPRVTTVALASLPDDPGFEFIWRYRRQYPDDSQFFWLQVFKHYLYHPKITLIVAEEVASVEEKREDRGEAVATIIAFALWERNGKSMLTQALTNLWSKGVFNALHCYITFIENWAIGKEFRRRDGDPKRMIAFQQALNYTHSKYWEKMYPQNYYLVLLATHPDYRRRGAGTALTQWGVDQALAAGIDVGLEASPMGFPLYQHMGFVLLENLVIKPDADDDPASMLLRVMVYDKNNKFSMV